MSGIGLLVRPWCFAVYCQIVSPLVFRFVCLVVWAYGCFEVLFSLVFCVLEGLVVYSWIIE